MLDVGRQAQAVEHLGDHELERSERAHPLVVLVRDAPSTTRSIASLGGHATQPQHLGPDERRVCGVGAAHEQAVVERVELERIEAEAERRIRLEVRVGVA